MNDDKITDWSWESKFPNNKITDFSIGDFVRVHYIPGLGDVQYVGKVVDIFDKHEHILVIETYTENGYLEYFVQPEDVELLKKPTLEQVIYF